MTGIPFEIVDLSDEFAATVRDEAESKKLQAFSEHLHPQHHFF